MSGFGSDFSNVASPHEEKIRRLIDKGVTPAQFYHYWMQSSAAHLEARALQEMISEQLRPGGADG